MTTNRIFTQLTDMASNKEFNENYNIRTMYKNINDRKLKLLDKNIKVSYTKREYMITKGNNIMYLKYDKDGEIDYDDANKLTTNQKCILREIITLYNLLFENWKYYIIFGQKD